MFGMARWKQIPTSSISEESDELVTNPTCETIILTLIDYDGFRPAP